MKVRLIDVDKLIDDIKKSGINKLSKGGDEVELTNFVKGLGEAIKIADTACVIDPVKHGNWILDETIKNPRYQIKTCSLCGCRANGNSFNYCPNCGAKMSDNVSDK